MGKKSNLFIVSTFVTLGLSLFQGNLAMEGEAHSLQGEAEATREFHKRRIETESFDHNVPPFEQLPKEIRLYILKHAVAVALEDKVIAKLPLVCKEWQTMVKDHRVDIFTFAICQIYSVDEETCKKFLNARLVYKPNKNSDVGKIELPITDFANPLEGTFDLSRCGDAGKYLSISTGYRKAQKQENANKVEIWLTPRFLVEKEINNRAKHFRPIYPNDWPKEPVNIIWAAGTLPIQRYDYLPSADHSIISKGKSLGTMWTRAYWIGQVGAQHTYNMEMVGTPAPARAVSYLDLFFLKFKEASHEEPCGKRPHFKKADDFPGAISIGTLNIP